MKKIKDQATIAAVVSLVFGAAAGYWLGYDIGFEKAADEGISSFAECAARNNIIQESYPSVCRTKDGRSFIEPVDNLNSIE